MARRRVRPPRSVAALSSNEASFLEQALNPEHRLGDWLDRIFPGDEATQEEFSPRQSILGIDPPVSGARHLYWIVAGHVAIGTRAPSYSQRLFLGPGGVFGEGEILLEFGSVLHERAPSSYSAWVAPSYCGFFHDYGAELLGDDPRDCALVRYVTDAQINEKLQTAQGAQLLAIIAAAHLRNSRSYIDFPALLPSASDPCQRRSFLKSHFSERLRRIFVQRQRAGLTWSQGRERQTFLVTSFPSPGTVGLQRAILGVLGFDHLHDNEDLWLDEVEPRAGDDGDMVNNFISCGLLEHETVSCQVLRCTRTVLQGWSEAANSDTDSLASRALGRLCDRFPSGIINASSTNRSARQLSRGTSAGTARYVMLLRSPQA